MYSVGSHLTETSSVLVLVTSTHPSTQWAAVTTQSGLMIEPPHWWLPLYSIDTWKHYYWVVLLKTTKFVGNSLRNLNFEEVFLRRENDSFTWYGKSSIFTGRPPIIRPARRGRWRVVTAPEKIVYLWQNLQESTTTLFVYLLRCANQILTD